jgi:hypothetical protein
MSVRLARDVGLTELSNYMLYNFHDSPTDLFERMRLNVALNEELGIRIWSFPMRYQPTDLPNRSHVGEKWTRFQLRSLQIILQATHGVVSGEPDFFKRAFGDTPEEFEGLLLRPQRFIFHRDWYEKFDGKPELEDYLSKARQLTKDERNSLLSLLSSCDPRNFDQLRRTTTSLKLRDILTFYVPISKAAELDVLTRRRALGKSAETGPQPSDEIRIEDAGLEYESSLQAEPEGAAA